MTTLTARLHDKLATAKSALLFGVGGGNDSVTALLLREQLRLHYGFAPERLDIAAMMPDALEYRNYDATGHERAWRLRPDSERWVQGTRVTGFPEPLLARAAGRFGVGSVYGLDMRAGAEGVYGGLSHLLTANGYDLVLACDVGGDFIAAPENVDVLSPMMDAYALHALRRLDTPGSLTRFAYAIFGLGTDGESSPEMLARALANLGEYEDCRFDADVAPDVERFYRDVIEPNRYSRTADFTFREIRGGADLHAEAEGYRVRFHTRPEPKRRRSYTGAFEHPFDPTHYGRYLLFDRLDGVRNPFCVPCRSGLEWVRRTCDNPDRVHHEAVGLTLPDGEGHAVNVALASRKFSEPDRAAIFADTVSALRTGVYGAALVYREDLPASVPQGIGVRAVGEYLALLSTGDAGTVAPLTASGW